MSSADNERTDSFNNQLQDLLELLHDAVEIAEEMPESSTEEDDDGPPSPPLASIPATAVTADPFDINLPTEHSYLGNLDRVSGVDCLEPGHLYKLPICYHPTLVFPGEQVPMVISASMFGSEFNSTQDDGCLFGLVFPKIYATSSPKLYGVTCQIYEKGVNTNNSRQLFIKSRACQRFVVTRPHNTTFADILSTSSRHQVYANVEILPEIVLPDPVFGIETNSLSKFRQCSAATRRRLRRFEGGRLPWPGFLYDHYDLEKAMQTIRGALSNMAIESMPSDPVAMSFWCGKNVQLHKAVLFAAFRTNSVTNRLLIIAKDIANQKRFFVCRRCNQKLALFSDLFIMSKEGVYANYCNPAGYIHETITLTAILPGATNLTSGKSAEFSWFPGYEWQTMSCGGCYSHLGWKFTATGDSMEPRWFYALAGSGTTVVNSLRAAVAAHNDVGVEIDSDTEMEELGDSE